MTSTAMRIKMARKRRGPRAWDGRLSAGGDSDDLASLVIAASRANAVGHVRGGALRTCAQLGQAEHAVIRAPHALTASGGFSFGDTHNLIIGLI